MKGNLIDEKEEQEKGVAVRERHTLETKKCRARPSERHGGISGASFDEGGLKNALLLASQPQRLRRPIRSLCERDASASQTSLAHPQDSPFLSPPRHLKLILCV